jgi:hypothetical protein
VLSKGNGGAIDPAPHWSAFAPKEECAPGAAGELIYWREV